MSILKCQTCKEHFDGESTLYYECPNCGEWICENCLPDLMKKFGHTKCLFFFNNYPSEYKTIPAKCGSCSKKPLGGEQITDVTVNNVPMTYSDMILQTEKFLQNENIDNETKSLVNELYKKALTAYGFAHEMCDVNGDKTFGALGKMLIDKMDKGI